MVLRSADPAAAAAGGGGGKCVCTNSQIGAQPSHIPSTPPPGWMFAVKWKTNLRCDCLHSHLQCKFIIIIVVHVNSIDGGDRSAHGRDCMVIRKRLSSIGVDEGPWGFTIGQLKSCLRAFLLFIRTEMKLKWNCKMICVLHYSLEIIANLHINYKITPRG